MPNRITVIIATIAAAIAAMPMVAAVTVRADDTSAHSAPCVRTIATQGCQWRSEPTDAFYIAPHSVGDIGRGYSDLDIRVTDGARAERCARIIRGTSAVLIANRCRVGLVVYYWYES